MINIINAMTAIPSRSKNSAIKKAIKRIILITLLPPFLFLLARRVLHNLTVFDNPHLVIFRFSRRVELRVVEVVVVAVAYPLVSVVDFYDVFPCHFAPLEGNIVGNRWLLPARSRLILAAQLSEQHAQCGDGGLFIA
jgi:hypothetical protein